jgi:hypothetical protein
MMRFVLGALLVSFVWAHAQVDRKTVDTRVPNSSVVAYQNVFELIRLVNGLAQLEEHETLKFTPDQATAMLRVLEPLTNETNLTPELATQTTTSLLALLITEQQVWWEELKKTQQRLFQKRSAQIRSLEPLTIYHVVVPGYPHLRNLIEKKEAFNPFQLEPNAATLTALVTALQKAQ